MEEVIRQILATYPGEEYYAPRKVEPLVSQLAENPRYGIFSSHIHVVGGGGAHMTFEVLAQMILKRAQVAGPLKAIEEVDAYLDSDEVNLHFVLLLSDIYTDSDFTFSNGVSLMSVESLPDSNLRDELLSGRVGAFLSKPVQKVLVSRFSHPKQVESAISEDAGTQDWSQARLLRRQSSLLEDTRLLLSLARPARFGVPVFASAVLVPRGLDFLASGYGYGLFSEPQTSLGPEIIGFELCRADELIQAFAKLDEETRESLRIALKRLNDYKVDILNWANQGINLRICIENLFIVEGEEFGIQKKLKARMPSRTKFSEDEVEDIYKTLSRAVHTGKARMNPKIEEKEIASEVRKVLIDYIQSGGYPDWPS